MILSFDLEECQLPAVDDYFLALTVWYVPGRSDLHYSLLQLVLCHSSHSLGYFVPTANCYRWFGWFGPNDYRWSTLELDQPFLQSLDLDVVRSQFLQDLLRLPNRLEYRVLDMGSQNSSDWLWIDLRQIFEVFLKMFDLENHRSDQVLNLSSQDLVVDVKYYFDVILRIL